MDILLNALRVPFSFNYFALGAELPHCAGAEVRTCSFETLTCPCSYRQEGECLAVCFLSLPVIKRWWTSVHTLLGR